MVLGHYIAIFLLQWSKYFKELFRPEYEMKPSTCISPGIYSVISISFPDDHVPGSKTPAY